MVKREERDTTSGDPMNKGLKELSNDVVFGFFNDEKIVKLVSEAYRIATSADKDSDRLNAIKEIFDRVLGKAKQTNFNMNIPVDSSISDEELLKLLSKDNVVKHLLGAGETKGDKTPTTD